MLDTSQLPTSKAIQTDLDLTSYEKVCELITALVNKFDTLPNCKAFWQNVEVGGTQVACITFVGMTFDEDANWVPSPEALKAIEKLAALEDEAEAHR